MADTYQEITDRIVKKLEEGTVPWHKPWSAQGAFPKNLKTRKEYNGINVLLLGLAGYASPYWATLKQIKSLGGWVKFEEFKKSESIVFWNIKEREVENEDGEKETKRFSILRFYSVYNFEQCEFPLGAYKRLPPELSAVNKPDSEFKPIERCAEIAKGYKGAPKVTHGGDRAFYSPLKDSIGIPYKKDFHSREEYYSTLFHEFVHSTGHQGRLNRSGIVKSDGFGSEVYSEEELVAEIGAAFLCGAGGISPKVIDNSAAYIKSWLKRLKNDNRLIVRAAAAASKASDRVLGKDIAKQYNGKGKKKAAKKAEKKATKKAKTKKTKTAKTSKKAS